MLHQKGFIHIPTPSKWMFIIPVIGVVITLLLFETSLVSVGSSPSLDVYFQNPFYSSTGWLVSKANNPILHFLFYSGFKNGLIIFTVLCFLAFVSSFFQFGKRWKSNRAQLLLIVLSVAIAPVIIGILKKESNIYTPAQTAQYGGKAPYVRLFDSYPDSYKEENLKHPGRGYPAGHASGAFSLIALAFAASTKWFRKYGWLIAISLGWLTGFYQQVRGEHYLSHTIMTMFLVWLIVALLALAVKRSEGYLERW